MSSSLSAPPPSIQIGGGDPGGDPGAAMGAASDGNAKVVDLLKQALDLIQQASDAEPDDQDTAAIAKIAMAIHQQIAAEAKLQDDVMGAGPGVKMIRKAGGPGGAPPSDSGGY